MSLESVKVKLIAFASAKDLMKQSEVTINLPKVWPSDDQLKQYICGKLFPQLTVIQSTIILAINEEYIHQQSSIILNESDVIALIPPITGG